MAPARAVAAAARAPRRARAAGTASVAATERGGAADPAAEGRGPPVRGRPVIVRGGWPGPSSIGNGLDEYMARPAVCRRPASRGRRAAWGRLSEMDTPAVALGNALRQCRRQAYAKLDAGRNGGWLDLASECLGRSRSWRRLGRRGQRIHSPGEPRPASAGEIAAGSRSSFPARPAGTRRNTAAAAARHRPRRGLRREYQRLTAGSPQRNQSPRNSSERTCRRRRRTRRRARARRRAAGRG